MPSAGAPAPRSIGTPPPEPKCPGGSDRAATSSQEPSRDARTPVQGTQPASSPTAAPSRSTSCRGADCDTVRVEPGSEVPSQAGTDPSPVLSSCTSPPSLAGGCVRQQLHLIGRTPLRAHAEIATDAPAPLAHVPPVGVSWVDARVCSASYVSFATQGTAASPQWSVAVSPHGSSPCLL